MIQKFVQQIKNTVQESLDGIHTCIPGEIVSFDAAKCTAIVKPKGKFKRPDGAEGGLSADCAGSVSTSSRAARRKAASVFL